MFRRIKLRIQDMRTIGKLIPGADKEAHMMGEEEPGAEHFLLSALKLSDCSALHVFERVGASSDQFKAAIKKQYSDALNAIGIDSTILERDLDSVLPERTGFIISMGTGGTEIRLPHSKPSGEAVMKELYALKQQDRDNPLLGAHVVAVVARMEHGISARAFKAMGIERSVILSAVDEELNTH